MKKSAASCAVASSPEASFLAALSRKDSICGFMVALLNLLNVCVAFSVGVLGYRGNALYFRNLVKLGTGREETYELHGVFNILGVLVDRESVPRFAVFVCALFAGVSAFSRSVSLPMML